MKTPVLVFQCVSPLPDYVFNLSYVWLQSECTQVHCPPPPINSTDIIKNPNAHARTHTHAKHVPKSLGTRIGRESHNVALVLRCVETLIEHDTAKTGAAGSVCCLRSFSTHIYLFIYLFIIYFFIALFR
jgi:hypothetical protein